MGGEGCSGSGTTWSIVQGGACAGIYRRAGRRCLPRLATPLLSCFLHLCLLVGCVMMVRGVGDARIGH